MKGYTEGRTGGKDKIYGGDRVAGSQILSGGGNDDIIIGGNEISGTNVVFGDQ